MVVEQKERADLLRSRLAALPPARHSGTIYRAVLRVSPTFWSFMINYSRNKSLTV